MVAQDLRVAPDTPQAEVARMNIVGALRSVGYKVSGGRGGGKFYKVLSWTEPKPSTTVDEWDPKRRSILDWVHRGEQVTTKHRDVINRLLAGRGDRRHDWSFGFIWAYELARDTGYLCEVDGGLVLVVQRFQSRPRFRIVYLGNSLQQLEKTAHYLAPASYMNVQIRGLPSDLASQWAGEVWKRQQAVVELGPIVSDPRTVYSKRTCELIRQNWREVDYWDAGSNDVADMHAVLEKWRMLNEAKHRQPALTRDRVCFDNVELYPFAFIGRRQGVPVTTTVWDRLPGDPKCATLMVEKSLNYSTIEGGHSGTSDASMYYAFVRMYQQGIKFVNLGTYEGGGIGLPQHKQRLSRGGVLDVTDYTAIYETPASERPPA